MIGLKAENTALLIHIEHSKPIDINEFTTSLNSLGRLYQRYVQDKGYCEDVGKSKLYVEKIEDGCIDIYLTELIGATLIPFIENANVILDFSKHIRDIIYYYTKGMGEKPHLSIEDCKDVGNIFSVTAGDNNGQTTIGAIDRSSKTNIYNNCTFNFTESNSAQNQLNEERKELSENQSTNRVFRGVLMTIYQVRSERNTDVGNKAVIEEISRNKLKVVFANDDLKKAILFIEDGNPMQKAYYVDGEVLSVRGKDVAYKITALHDVLDLEE